MRVGLELFISVFWNQESGLVFRWAFQDKPVVIESPVTAATSQSVVRKAVERLRSHSPSVSACCLLVIHFSSCPLTCYPGVGQLLTYHKHFSPEYQASLLHKTEIPMFALVSAVMGLLRPHLYKEPRTMP